MRKFRMVWLAALVGILVMMLAACTGDPTPAGVSVESVTLNKTTLSLTLGTSQTLQASINPDEAGNKEVTWASSDAAKVKVENGKVTAMAIGSATITVTTVDGNKTAMCEVTVTPVMVGSVALDKASANLLVGENVTLVATVTPDNAANKAVTWASSDSAVASVSAGKVTALKTGTTKITATAADGSGKSASCDIAVVSPTAIGTLEQLLAVKDALGGYYYLSANIDATSVQWESLGAFTGTLDGKGHSITIANTASTTNVGLFTKVELGATVKNLAVLGSGTVQFANWAGGICQDNAGLISNCLVNIKMNTTGALGYMGGIACNNHNPGRIEYCVVLSEINGPGTTAQGSWGAKAPPNGGIAVGANGDAGHTLGEFGPNFFCIDTSGALCTFGLGADVYGEGVDGHTAFKKTEAELKTVATFADWSTTVWSITAGQLPQLKVQA